MPDYPVTLTYAPDEGQNQLWGIPLVGLIVRGFLCIPQGIVLAALGLLMYVVAFVNWIPILVNGRQAAWVYTLAGGTFRMSLRTTAYILLMTGVYPPFWIEGDHPVNLTLRTDEEQNRLWGIPFVGILVRLFLLIPHVIALAVLGVVVGVLALFTWVPVLVNGRTGDWVIRWIGGFYRWSARVYAYAFLLTAKYPPFSLD
jgi:cobalamin synthase